MTGWSKTGRVKQQRQVTLNGNGGGEVQFAVRHAHEQWVVDAVVLSTSQSDTQQPYPTVLGHLGADQSRAHRVFHSPDGHKDTLTGSFTMDDGSDLYVSYVGGVPGTIATVTITGEAEEET